jgi:hypothetical protein
MKQAVISLVVILVIAGCSHKSKLYIIGGPELYAGMYGYTDVEIFSDPILDTASVKINGNNIPELTASGSPFYVKIFEDSTIPVTGHEYKMEFTTNGGNGSATATVPADFTLYAPDSVGLNTAVVISWNKNANADWYMVSFYFNDTLFNYRDSMCAIEDTTAIVPASWFDLDGYLDISIDAVSGPIMKEKTAGNISGASGFWLGINSQMGNIMIGHPIFTAHQPKIESAHYRLLRYIAPFDEDAAEALEELK